MEKFEQGVERIGSYEQAEQVIDCWNTGCDGRKAESAGLKGKVREWFRKKKE